MFDTDIFDNKLNIGEYVYFFKDYVLLNGIIRDIHENRISLKTLGKDIPYEIGSSGPTRLFRKQNFNITNGAIIAPLQANSFEIGSQIEVDKFGAPIRIGSPVCCSHLFMIRGSSHRIKKCIAIGRVVGLKDTQGRIKIKLDIVTSIEIDIESNKLIRQQYLPTDFYNSELKNESAVVRDGSGYGTKTVDVINMDPSLVVSISETSYIKSYISNVFLKQMMVRSHSGV